VRFDSINIGGLEVRRGVLPIVYSSQPYGVHVVMFGRPALPYELQDNSE
jgi:hypothetical protein